MNNEEAIEILKFLIDRFMNIKELKHDAEAMQTVLNYIEELEKENAVKENHIKIVSAYNEELEKDNKELRKYYSSRKEVEELKDTIKCLHESSKKYINKQKIRDKIEELETKKKKYGFGSIESIIFLNKVQVLNELLKEEKCQL